MSQDLRSYLDLIKQNHPEDFLVVSREVDPAFEITAITVKLEQEAKRRPIILFEKVKGTQVSRADQPSCRPLAIGGGDPCQARGDAARLSAAPWKNLFRQSSLPKRR